MAAEMTTPETVEVLAEKETGPDSSDPAPCSETAVQAQFSAARCEAMAESITDVVPRSMYEAARREAEEARAERDRLRAQKWDVQHTDTMNDFVALALDRDGWQARADAAEARLALADRLAEAVEASLRYEAVAGSERWQAERGLRAALAAYREAGERDETEGKE